MKFKNNPTNVCFTILFFVNYVSQPFQNRLKPMSW